MSECGHIKILLIEDDEDDFLITRDFIQEISAQEYHLDWVSNYEEGRQTILAQQHDVYLIDYRLGPHNGLDLLKEALANDCRSPLILLTGLGDKEMDQAAMRAGADDYLVKGQITAALLERSIRHSIQRKRTELKLRASEERLRQAQKLEAMGTLAGGIAHDFNNILAIIGGYTARLKNNNLAPDQRDHCLNALEHSVERGAALVRQILAFARKSKSKMEDVDANIVIRELTEMLQETFPKTINFVLDLEPSPGSIHADVSQLHQVLLNLCVNARDAMPEGGTLTLRSRTVSPDHVRKTFPEAPDNDYLELAVEDTGSGMDEATRRRIFEPFFTTKAPERGTGLGLAMVYGIVEQHKGFIDVQSVIGSGSVFSVYLPCVHGSNALIPVSPREQENAWKGSETILLVEDEDLLVDITTNLLEEKGYKVLVARDGKEGLEKFTAHQKDIHLVVTDMGLPVLGGWELFRKIRELSPEVRILVISGYLDPDIRVNILKAGARDILQKPYGANELFKGVRHALEDLPRVSLPVSSSEEKPIFGI